jgi:hypothetical protein
MFSVCANPDCSIVFDFREGRYFRFHKNHMPGEAEPNTHSVQHFWLCAKCSDLYTLENQPGRGIVMCDRRESSTHSVAVRFISAA